VRHRRNPDERIRRLERLAAQGDQDAARELANALLRSGQLTVQDLVRLGAPAVEVLPQDLVERLHNLLQPGWELIHKSFDLRAQEEWVGVSRFWSEDAAWAEAATRLVPLMEQGYQDIDWPEEEDVHALVEGMREALASGDWREAVAFAREIQQEYELDEEGNRVEVRRV
jgi:hypothetical protein